MGQPIKILIVEDEMIIAANIAMQLRELGYEVTAMVSRGLEALTHIRKNPPDIVLLDIQLKGTLDGIETAQLMQKEYDIPIIYLTANADDFYFNRAKGTHPFAFISKPFKKLDLQHAIELTANQMMFRNNPKPNPTEAGKASFVLSDRIFVRHNEKMIKVIIKDIYYVEAERNYCKIHTKDKVYLLVTTLKDMEEKLPTGHFLRIHRSYIANLAQVDEVSSSHVVISKKAVPMGKGLRSKLLDRLHTI
ncbi:response regulator [Flavobacteriaceae bacterium F89]|uniref:Response regulator n=1 Tax=Cerina litoralis TaxID=2874477 RepID=A0AAE3ETG2_9FLAO|nr:response regulator [Cerina litoralis]MCG2459277.1 response regulator [Cerina litoralis]